MKSNDLIQIEKLIEAPVPKNGGTIIELKSNRGVPVLLNTIMIQSFTNIYRYPIQHGSFMYIFMDLNNNKQLLGFGKRLQIGILIGTLLAHIDSCITAFVGPLYLHRVVEKAFVSCKTNMNAFYNIKSDFNMKQTYDSLNNELREYNKLLYSELVIANAYVIKRRFFGGSPVNVTNEIWVEFFKQYTDSKGDRKIDSYYIGIILRALLFETQAPILEYFTELQRNQLLSYCNTILEYLKSYLILSVSYLNKTINYWVLDYFNTNFVNIKPDDYGLPSTQISKVQYENLLDSIELGTTKFIVDIIENKIPEFENQAREIKNPRLPQLVPLEISMVQPLTSISSFSKQITKVTPKRSEVSTVIPASGKEPKIESPELDIEIKNIKAKHKGNEARKLILEAVHRYRVGKGTLIIETISYNYNV